MHYSSFPGRINVQKTSEQCFQPLRKATKEDRYLSAGLGGKQVDDENEWRGLYNGEKTP